MILAALQNMSGIFAQHSAIYTVLCSIPVHTHEHAVIVCVVYCVLYSIILSLQEEFIFPVNMGQRPSDEVCMFFNH